MKTANPDHTGETLEPTAQTASAGLRLGDPPEPVVEIAFHSDLARVGDAYRSDAFTQGDEVIVGRDAPAFGVAPITDPCVSRTQLIVRWGAGHDAFALRVPEVARRAVKVTTIAGEPVTTHDEIPPGSLVAIGDRILLLLALRPPPRAGPSYDMVGASDAMDALRREIETMGVSDATVLVYGETGTGKELVARAIHASSGRAGEPMLVVNCAAIPDTLLESQLFGHKRGAFTGAASDRVGFFAAAGRGTLLLDEIGELPLPMQAKLLRALQERKICPVGALVEESVSARVLAATNRDLAHDAAAGTFREDLLYRLSTLTVGVAPLRERREDVPRLFRSFFADASDGKAGLDRFWRSVDTRHPPLPLTFMRRMLASEWPGNVRQLRNAVEKIAVANAQSERFVEPRGVTQPYTSVARPSTPQSSPAAPASREPPDRRQLLALLEDHDYVQRRVAAALGVSNSTVHRWMQALGLRRPRDIGRQELERELAAADFDVAATARRLRVSTRGLRLRLAELGLVDDR